MISKDCVIEPSKVFVFDLDNTLVFTNEANNLSYIKAIETVLNIEFPKFSNRKHRIDRSNITQILPEVTLKDYNEIINLKETLYCDFLFKTELNQPVINLLNKYSQTNVTVLVTNCKKGRAHQILNHYDLLNKFDNIFYNYRNENSKYESKVETVINKLNILAEDIILIENDINEIFLAKKNGVLNENVIHIRN
jgi:beta-phosphoglucomutase-like phosphatase (HAD superfamily)